MCGIAGIVLPSSEEVSVSALTQMTRALHRRGPDDEGYYIDPLGGCGLGHRRLSIIDVSGGHQPLSSENGNVQTVVNGEIYNYRSLRDELIACGYSFATRSDSEVVAHGFAAWGEDLFRRLDGMFALAIWDARNRKLYLARDRMGKKPSIMHSSDAQRNR